MPSKKQPQPQPQQPERLVVGPDGALNLLARLTSAGPPETEALLDSSVILPDGSITALGELTGSQIADLREWLAAVR
ncbi:hypothetical protein E9529_15760 [Blastococcus sp. KM273128]|uniref:hypothetical protein n=1 Tax=Blastococcus sp. KM273128 TaxID=2570314 RepID=UPI001F3EA1FD|nr:hypothetical protein [Blastococcus sp. KM273128]MCF6745703.1 hypothetical protein [Blastococcus sp. KM273128]